MDFSLSRCARDDVDIAKPFRCQNIVGVLLVQEMMVCSLTPKKWLGYSCWIILPESSRPEFVTVPCRFWKDTRISIISGGGRGPPNKYMVLSPVYEGVERGILGRDIAWDGIWYQEYGTPGHVPIWIMVIRNGGGEWVRLLQSCGIQCECGMKPLKSRGRRPGHIVTSASKWRAHMHQGVQGP